MPRTWRALALLLAALLGGPSPVLAAPITIIDRPIRFDDERLALSVEYLRKHYGIESKDARITPRAVVVHWTATLGLEGTWQGFNRVRMRAARRYLVRGGLLNVSSHFLVGREGRILRLLPETTMARHCIGLNYDAIGIENLGGPDHPLTEAQLLANEALIRHLAGRYPIRTLIGHYEWKRVENTPIFRERDATYRNAKADPGPAFMRRLRSRLQDLDLEPRPGRTPATRAARPARNR